MADISVSLVLDDSQYTGKLKLAAQAADNFGKTSSESAQKAGKGMEDLGGKVEKLHGKFELLQKAILGVGLIEFGRSAMEYADRIDDVAKAAGLSVGTILEFDKAVRQSGGGSEAASKGISTLYTKVTEATQGNYGLQQSFAKIGISLKELETISNKDLLIRTVEGLANVKTQTEKVALANELMGKAMKGVPIDEVDERLKKLLGTMEAEEARVIASAEANKRLQNAVDNLKIAFLDVFGPFMDQLGNMNQDTGKAKETIVELTKVFATLIALEIGAKFIEMAKGVRELAIAFGVLRASTGWIGILVNAVVTLGVVAATYFGLSAAIDHYVEKNDKATESTKTNTAHEEENAKQKRTVTDEVTKLNAAIEEQIQAIMKANDQVAKSIANDTSYIGMGHDKVALQKALTAESLKYAQQLDQIDAKIKQAGLAGPKSAESGTVGKLQKEREELLKNQAINKAAIEENLNNQFKVAATDRDQIFINKELYASEQRILDIKDQVAQLSMTNGQRQIAAIDAVARKTIAAKIEEERALLGTNATVDMVSQERVDAITKAVNAQATLEKQATQDSIDSGRKFNVGWKLAYNQYVDDATNAANQGKAVFDAMTSAMNSAIDKFVMTGKFSMKDFATSVIQDLEKIALKAAVANVISAAGFGSLFAGPKALGGDIPAGQFALVGEAGPEFVKGPASVTSAKDTAGMMGGSTSHNTYNINAVDAKSVAQLFAENRMTLFGTVEQARRELPMRTR